MKTNCAGGLLALLLLSALLAPLHVQAASDALQWTAVGKPGDYGNLVVSPSEVSEIAIGRDGVLYVADSENSKFYRSLDSGVTWEDITLYLPKDGGGLPVTATKIAISPDKPGIVAVVTNGGTRVYLSTNGGIDWIDTGNMPGLAGTIQAIAISGEYSMGGKTSREIAIGTAVWGNSSTDGQVWVRLWGGLGTSWQDQNLTIGGHTGGEVSALAYSPNYPNDPALLVVASTNSDVAAYPGKTLLCLLNRDTLVWNNLTGYPVEIAAAGDAPVVSYIHSSLALPSNYSSAQAESRQLFVSYDREPDANDDVYWLNDTSVTRLNVLGGANIDICCIAYYGTTMSGKLLAGDVNPVPGSLTVQVRWTLWTLSPLTWAWHTSSVPPTGPGNARVAWSPDGTIAYCGTSQSPGVALDESAFSASIDDGDKWRQLGLIDTEIMVADVVPSPDGQNLFITTYSLSGPEGIWRSGGDPLGWVWERLLTLDTSTNAVILRLSPGYSQDYTIYAAEVGGNLMAVTHNRGNTWQWCRGTPGLIVDLAVADENTLYAALPGGNISRSINDGLTWWGMGITYLPDINMLTLADQITILVGGRNGDVAYSTDGGDNFTLIREVIGSGDVQVVADASYPENYTIYAATNIADEGIWRWVIGVSSRWEQIDSAVTGLGGGQRIGGLAIGTEGTLYALRIEPASSTRGGVSRSLNPRQADATEVEFDLANFSLPAGTAFDPTLVFPNTLPYLKLSGDDEQNELWTIDTANQIIYCLRDTLCKFGPNLALPEAGGIVPIDSSGYITSLILQWQEMAGTMEYEVAIYRDADAIQTLWSGTTIDIGIIATGGNNPAQLLSGSTYYWRVRATQLVKSPWSEMWSFNPALGEAQWSPSAAPDGVSPSPGATGVPIRPAFAWQPADWATGYELILARDSEFTDAVVALTGADALQATVWGCDRDLDYSTTYFWKVRAVSATSHSQWGTGVFTTETATTAPLPPQSSASPLVSEPAPPIPAYLIWVAIAVGAVLVVALLVFIVRTGS